MNKTKRAITPGNFVNRIPELLFLVSILITVFTTWHVTGSILDSDASSELVLAHQLSQTHQLLSQDWLYSTELRVLNTQLVYTPLFWIFDDWHLVRFFGALILQTIMILSYAFLLQEARCSRRIFFLSASILLLPVSITYGRIVLYHCFYIPHIALSFFLVGLTLGYTREVNWKKPKAYLRLFLLLLFSFIGGLGSVRQLMITHAPLLLSAVIFAFLEDTHDKEPEKAAIFSRGWRTLFAVAALSALASVAGLKVNTDILSKYYSFGQQSQNTLGFIPAVYFGDILYGYFHQFGFRDGVPMLSLTGILSLAGIVVGVYCLVISIQKFSRHRKGCDIGKTILYSFFFYYTVIMMAVFIVTGGKQHYFFPLYLVLCLSWAAPTLILNLEQISPQLHPFHAKRLFSWLCIILLMVNSFANVTFLYGSKTFDQVYEGLRFKNMHQVEDISGAADFLTNGGYDIGYASFWNANIITEMTDGGTRMINLEFNPGDGNIWYHNWLTSLYLREIPAEKPFLLLSAEETGSFADSDSRKYCTQVYKDDKYCVFRISDIEEFIKLLYA